MANRRTRRQAAKGNRRDRGMARDGLREVEKDPQIQKLHAFIEGLPQGPYTLEYVQELVEQFYALGSGHRDSAGVRAYVNKRRLRFFTEVGKRTEDPTAKGFLLYVSAYDATQARNAIQHRSPDAQRQVDISAEEKRLTGEIASRLFASCPDFKTMAVAQRWLEAKEVFLQSSLNVEPGNRNEEDVCVQAGLFIYDYYVCEVLETVLDEDLTPKQRFVAAELVADLHVNLSVRNVQHPDRITDPIAIAYRRQEVFDEHEQKLAELGEHRDPYVPQNMFYRRDVIVALISPQHPHHKDARRIFEKHLYAAAINTRSVDSLFMYIGVQLSGFPIYKNAAEVFREMYQVVPFATRVIPEEISREIIQTIIGRIHGGTTAILPPMPLDTLLVPTLDTQGKEVTAVRTRMSDPLLEGFLESLPSEEIVAALRERVIPGLQEDLQFHRIHGMREEPQTIEVAPDVYVRFSLTEVDGKEGLAVTAVDEQAFVNFFMSNSGDSDLDPRSRAGTILQALAMAYIHDRTVTEIRTQGSEQREVTLGAGSERPSIRQEHGYVIIQNPEAEKPQDHLGEQDVILVPNVEGELHAVSIRRPHWREQNPQLVSECRKTAVETVQAGELGHLLTQEGWNWLSQVLCAENAHRARIHQYVAALRAPEYAHFWASAEGDRSEHIHSIAQAILDRFQVEQYNELSPIIVAIAAEDKDAARAAKKAFKDKHGYAAKIPNYDRAQKMQAEIQYAVLRNKLAEKELDSDQFDVHSIQNPPTPESITVAFIPVTVANQPTTRCEGNIVRTQHATFVKADSTFAAVCALLQEFA